MMLPNLKKYCVLFVDLLGQGAELDKLRAPNDLPQEALGEAMDSTLGKVLGVRDTMLHLLRMGAVFDVAKQHAIQELPGNVRHWLDEVSQTHLNFQ